MDFTESFAFAWMTIVFPSDIILMKNWTLGRLVATATVLDDDEDDSVILDREASDSPRALSTSAVWGSCSSTALLAAAAAASFRILTGTRSASAASSSSLSRLGA